MRRWNEIKNEASPPESFFNRMSRFATPSKKYVELQKPPPLPVEKKPGGLLEAPKSPDPFRVSEMSQYLK